LPTVLTIDFAYAVLLRSIVIITLPTIHVGNIASLPLPTAVAFCRSHDLIISKFWHLCRV